MTSSCDNDRFSESESDTDDNCHAQCAAFNEYEGFCPPSGVKHMAERVSAEIKPLDFFEQYVKTRRPAAFSDPTKDLSFDGHQWTNSRLSARAGEAKVLVENRECADGFLSFGTSSTKVEMKYGDFINAVVVRDTRYYLTTQDLERFFNEYDEFGLPKFIVAQPLCLLTDSYPVQPAILGNLIPHQISLWQGCTGKGSSSSSGLHHDFHDNLYVLIRGRKRFRLFPPSAARLLQLSGQPTKIHKNGLIVYASPLADPHAVTVRADGAPMSIIARQKHEEAEQKLEEAERQLEQLQSTVSVDSPELVAAEKLLADCEQKMDSALEELLRCSSVVPYICCAHLTDLCNRPITQHCWWITHLCNNQLIAQQLTDRACPVLCYRRLLWRRMPRLLLPPHSQWRCEAVGQRSVVPTILPATHILTAMNKLKVNINLR